MEDKRSFLLYYDHYDFVAQLDERQRSDLLIAIFSTGGVCECPELDALTRMAFTVFEKNINAANEKWQETRAKRAEAGRKGGKQRQALLSNAKQNEANQAVNVNVNDNVNVNGNVNVKENNKHNVHADGDEPRMNADSESVAGVKSSVGVKEQASPAKGGRHEANEHFDRLWELYPQKRGKSGVSDAKRRALLAVSVDEMGRAIDRYRKEVEGASFERQWLNGSTWFNGRYKDYLDDAYVPPAAPAVPVRGKDRAVRYVSAEGNRDFSDREE